MIQRTGIEYAKEVISEYPCLGLVGPRQIGKTTFAFQIIEYLELPYLYLDLESPSDYELLSNAEEFLQANNDKLIIIDEIQRRKELFPVLRSIIDKKRSPGRFILLGSASPELIRDSSESLAGRIAYLELTGLTLVEFPHQDKLWLNGGYPLIQSAKINVTRWYKNYLNTYIERDLPLLGMPGQANTIRRLTYMLSQFQGELLNKSNLSKSLELSSPTIKKYLDYLEGAFLIRLLPVFSTNQKKRLVKSPKVYFRDTGLLHFLFGINQSDALLLHPKFGLSWEGFVIEQIAAVW